jgi:hypothetical protein
MWIFSFYRTYFSIAAGAVLFFFFHSVTLWISSTVVLRLVWLGIETIISRWILERSYRKHIHFFKQELGPYGIRIANRADSNLRIKKSLCEVFVPHVEKLKKAVEQLDVMEALFKAGMRPDADEYLLHDLKLKYGKIRLEKEGIKPEKPV